MSSIRVEPEVVHGLAGRFGSLASDLESVAADGLAIGDTGDGGLTSAIEEFLEQSQSDIGELVRQFGEVQAVLEATTLGYVDVDSHVATEAVEVLSTTIGSER
jgi:hypothetical protein